MRSLASKSHGTMAGGAVAGTCRRYGLLVQPGTRRRWVALVLLGLLVSGVEAVGAVLIFLLLGLATNPGGPVEVPALGDLRRLAPDMASEQLLVATALCVAGFFMVRAIVVLAQSYYQSRVANLTSVDLSARLLERYLSLPYEFHLRRNSSELIRNANDSVGEILASVLMPGVRVVSEAFVALGLLLVLLMTAPVATALAGLVLAPLVGIVLHVVQPRATRLGLISQREGARSLQALQQSLHGFRDLTVLRRQRHFLSSYRASRLRIARTRYLRAVLNELPRVSIEAVVVGFIAAFLIVSTQVGRPGQSLALLGLFAYAALRIMPALNKVIAGLNSLRFGRAAVDDVVADLELPVPPPDDGSARLRLRRAIALEEVSFRYDGAEALTLEAIDLVIPAGESLGVVGVTGAGKSTLVDVLVGLSTPTTGRVTIDGVDLAGNEPAWQRSIGMVSQQVFLLDDTFRRNIALGIADADIDEEKLRAAVHLAQLDELVASLPQGLETAVGERGIRVSGGQRQRVAIARALYHEPDVLVFDEGTSALDNLTEAAIIAALAELRAHHTIITVAHRLSTVRDHDRIVLMRAGRIEDEGSFDDLARRNADFRRLARLAGSTR